MKKILMYADGAAAPSNPGEAGWGVVLQYQATVYGWSGYIGHTTNNRAEIAAVINGLKLLKESVELVIHSDSQYVVNTMTKGWARNKNSDLWDELEATLLDTRHKVEWKWVPRCSMLGMTKADELANNATRKQTVTRKRICVPGRS